MRFAGFLCLGIAVGWAGWTFMSIGASISGTPGMAGHPDPSFAGPLVVATLGAVLLGLVRYTRSKN